MYYVSGTVDRIANGQLADAVDDGQAPHLHSPDGSTFLPKMSRPPALKYDVISEI